MSECCGRQCGVSVIVELSDVERVAAWCVCDLVFRGSGRVVSMGISGDLRGEDIEGWETTFPQLEKDIKGVLAWYARELAEVRGEPHVRTLEQMSPGAVMTYQFLRLGLMHQVGDMARGGRQRRFVDWMYFTWQYIRSCLRVAVMAAAGQEDLVPLPADQGVVMAEILYHLGMALHLAVVTVQDYVDIGSFDWKMARRMPDWG